MSSERPLEGLVAAVTGGAGAIGCAIAVNLAEQGARVFSLDLARFDGDEAETVGCDMRDEMSVAGAIQAIVKRAGRLDIVVHAAGVSRESVVWKLSSDDWNMIHEVNLRGAFFMIKHAIPVMRLWNGGRIVLVGSINGSRGKFGTSAYSASKAGLIGLAKSVCRETGRFRILVNVVEPGWVKTPLTDALPQEIQDRALAETLLGEFVEPEDVAAVVGFLCGPGGRKITGQVIRVDSGQLLGG
jgi:3-oxoacyl-[acyl-carrier protein] reductase